MWANLRLAFSWTGATTTDIIAAPTDGRCIALVGLLVMCDGVTDITVRFGTADVVAGPIPQVAGGGWLFPPLAMPAAAGGWTNYYGVGAKNTKLSLISSAAVKVGGMVLYRLIGEQ